MLILAHLIKMIWKNFEFGNSYKGGNGGYGPVPLRQCHIQVCYLVNNVLQRKFYTLCSIVLSSLNPT